MHSTVEPVDPTSVRISVVVDPDELGPAINRAVRRLGSEVKVPGFRRGHVPRQVLEARLGRQAVLAEAIEHEAIPEFYERAISEHEVRPLARAKVDAEVDEAAEAVLNREPLEFSALVEVRPSLDLPAWRGVGVERPDVAVGEADVDAQLDRLRERFAQLEVIGRGIETGDFAQVDVRVTRHTAEIPGYSATDLLYEVGSGRIVPELDKALVGTHKGDILQFNATLPEGAAEHAGEEVTFQVLVKEAKAKRLPALNDEFAGEASEFDTLDELRADIRQRLERSLDEHVAHELEARVLADYLAQFEIPLPPTLVREELGYRADRFARQLAALQVPLERYLADTGTTQEQLEADLRAQAERAVAAQLVLDEVAAQEGLEATEAELGAEIDRLVAREAARSERSPAEVRRVVAGREGVIRGDILRSKALALMVEHADVRPAGSSGGAQPEHSEEP